MFNFALKITIFYFYNILNIKPYFLQSIVQQLLQHQVDILTFQLQWIPPRTQWWNGHFQDWELSCWWSALPFSFTSITKVNIIVLTLSASIVWAVKSNIQIRQGYYFIIVNFSVYKCNLCMFLGHYRRDHKEIIVSGLHVYCVLVYVNFIIHMVVFQNS